MKGDDMNELLQEFVDSRGLKLRIDPKQGVLRGVKILGHESRNGRRYSAQALASAVPLYEGAKVNVNHSKAGPFAPRDYEERIGVVRNITARPDAGLFGDLHFNPKHVLAEQLLWDAEHAPENVGFSHNVQARTKKEGATTLVDAILHVQSVDLVADPATTHGLFESESSVSLHSATADLVRLARPDLVTELTKSLAEENRTLKFELERYCAATKPLSREQNSIEPIAERFDTADFVRAIT
jgi:hypothetical protein